MTTENCCHDGKSGSTCKKNVSKLVVHIHWKNRKKDVDGQVSKHQPSANRTTKPSTKMHEMFSNTQKPNFGSTHFLVKEAKTHSMDNKQVQEKLCTEAKENPVDALQFAIAFADGLKRQKSYGNISQESNVKVEPICAVSTSQQRECWRCGAGNFTLNLLSKCNAPNAMCNYCGRKGHLERVGKQKKKDTNPKIGKSRGLANVYKESIQKIVTTMKETSI